MNMHSGFQSLIFVIFALVVGSLIFRGFKYGGLKAAMFGAPIERSVGQVEGRGRKWMKLAVKVHRLGGDPSQTAVGLEFVATSFASYQMLPITLSSDEARRLCSLLQTALNEPSRAG